MEDKQMGFFQDLRVDLSQAVTEPVQEEKVVNTVSMEKENIVVNNETHASEVDILKKENEDLNNKINRLEDLINEMLKKTETNNNVGESFCIC